MLLAARWEKSKQAMVLFFPQLSLPIPLQYFSCAGFNPAAQNWSQKLSLLNLRLTPCIGTVSMSQLCAKAFCPTCFQPLPRTPWPPHPILPSSSTSFGRWFCKKSRKSSHDGKAPFVLGFGGVSKAAVSHSSAKGSKGRKRELVLWQQQPRVNLPTLGPNANFPRLATADLPMSFWISQYFPGEQGLRQNAEIRVLSSPAFFSRLGKLWRRFLWTSSAETSLNPESLSTSPSFCSNAVRNPHSSFVFLPQHVTHACGVWQGGTGHLSGCEFSPSHLLCMEETSPEERSRGTTVKPPASRSTRRWPAAEQGVLLPAQCASVLHSNYFK